MKKLARAALVLSAFLASTPLVASPIVAQCAFADGTNLPCSGVQETLTLASANSPAASQTVYGGSYMLGQICATYGTVAFQVLGPDKATYETVASKTAADTTGGTIVQLQGGATVKATLSGTTGCAVSLGRLP